MKSFIKSLACGICFFSFSSAFAQQPTFSTTRFLPDTSFLGFNDSVKVTIKYVGSSQYTGPVGIYYTTDTFNFFPSGFYNYPQASLLPNDTLQISFSIAFDTSYFQGGNNIVVVWSSGNAIAPADSIWSNVYLKTTGAGVGEHQNTFSFSLYPSLANNFLQLDFQQTSFALEKIRILDIFGREVQSLSILKNEKKNLVNVYDLANGVYFLEVSSGNLRNTRKFVKID